MCYKSNCSFGVDGTVDAFTMGKETRRTLEVREEIAMRIVSATLLSLMITASKVLAAGGGTEGEGLGLLATFFITFGILIVLFQFIPGIMLFVGMLKGIFSAGNEKSHGTAGIK
jgi:hypothetical protein